MKVFTSIIDIAQPSLKRFWVAPHSDFKIGVKIAKNGVPVENEFTVKSGTTTLVADETAVDGFTVYTLSSGDAGFAEYVVEVSGVGEKQKIMQIVTDSTVFEVDERGGDMSQYATKNWVQSEISDFVTEDALSDFITAEDLTAYYTKSETSSATELETAFGNYLTAETEPAFAAVSADLVVDGDLTAYYTKSETSSANEIGTALNGKVTNLSSVSGIMKISQADYNALSSSASLQLPASCFPVTFVQDEETITVNDNSSFKYEQGTDEINVYYGGEMLFIFNKTAPYAYITNSAFEDPKFNGVSPVSNVSPCLELGGGADASTLYVIV